MYAIAFDLDTETLEKTYKNASWNNAYTDIRNFLEAQGFEHKQGSLYFGDKNKHNAVTCVVAIMDLTTRFSWFGPSVKDVRMLRIEEDNDLRPAVDRALAPAPAKSG